MGTCLRRKSVVTDGLPRMRVGLLRLLFGGALLKTRAYGRIVQFASWLTVVAIAALLVTGCGRPTPVPLMFNPAPWQNGEQHVFAVTDSDGRPAGTATLTASEGQNDKNERMWVIERVINAQGDQELVTVKVSDQGFRPQSSYLERTNASGTESVDAQYNHGQVDMTLNTRQSNMSLQRAQIPSDARETVTLPMLVRALPLAEGYATQINAYLPIAARLERVTVQVLGTEDVTVPAGTYKTWVVEIDTGDAQSKVWVAQAAPYPLIKYFDGRNKATFTLTQFRPMP
jgi:hypothetical protein